eukprot:2077309-Pleurochrysis_carterae.AAC.1
MMLVAAHAGTETDLSHVAEHLKTTWPVSSDQCHVLSRSVSLALVCFLENTDYMDICKMKTQGSS